MIFSLCHLSNQWRLLLCNCSKGCCLFRVCIRLVVLSGALPVHAMICYCCCWGCQSNRASQCRPVSLFCGGCAGWCWYWGCIRCLVLPLLSVVRSAWADWLLCGNAQSCSCFLRHGAWNNVCCWTIGRGLRLLWAALIGSSTWRVMLSSDCRLVSTFRPCWWNRLHPVEDKGAHNTGFMQAHRWALPQMHAIIAWILIRNDVDGGVPFEEGKRYGNRADSYVDLS